MTGIALSGRRNSCRRSFPLEAEERPAPRETPGVLGVDLDRGGFALLKGPAAVDRLLPAFLPHFENEDGPIGPRSGFDEAAIGNRIDEHIDERKLAAVSGRGRIAHPVARAQEDPLTIISGEPEPVLRG